MPDVVSIPDVSRVTDTETRRILLAMKTQIDRLSGVGRQSDRPVTVQELTDAGMLVDNGRSLISSAVLVNGTDTGPVSAARPENFQITNNNLTLITASWDAALSRNHLLTELWYNTTDDSGTATRLLTERGTSVTFRPPTEFGTTLYFWTRHINRDAAPSAYHATSGIALSTNGEVDERVLRIPFDIPSGGLANGVHTLPGKLPNNATVIRTRYNVTTTFTTAGVTRVALGIDADDTSGLLAAVTLVAGWTSGWHEGIQQGATLDYSIATTAERSIIATVTTGPITAGNAIIHLEYVVN